jgi:hypothetical protein
MRHLFTVAALLAAISFTPATTHANIFGLFGFDCCGGHNCGCANHGGCGCEQGCGCDQGCCCEAECGCEPACGCGCGCYANGRQYAGQKFCSNCRTHVPICPCTGPCGGCCEGDCGNCCEQACGCECGNCCEPTCGAGCGSCCAPCRYRMCPLKNCGFCCCCGHILSALCSCCPCAGCSGETYWNEWHNDPPRCQDPCNCHGDWIGPGCGPGCCPSCGPCNGGCAGAQGCPCNSHGYAAAGSVRNKSTNRAMVAQNARPVQSQPSQQVRMASRPVNRGQVNSSEMPSRSIQW